MTGHYKNLKTQVTARLARGRVLRAGLGPAGARRFEALVRELLGEARRQGAEPVLCTFATRWGAAEAERADEDAELQVLSINVELSLAGWLRTIEDFNAVLRRVAADEGLVLADVAGELTGRTDLFRDLWHFTPEGHDVVAGTIARAIAERPR